LNTPEATNIRGIIVAEVGQKAKKIHKTMKNNASAKRLENVPLSTEAPTGTTLNELLRSSKPVGELAAVQQQVNRILDLWADRTRAVLASLDISVGEFSASWHPCGDLTGLAEKLSQIEITPQVKANVRALDH
jgi:hypothetical protein